MAVGDDIYCTLVLNAGYLPGAAVLAHSLRDAGTTKKLACLIVQENLPSHTVEELQSLYNYVIPIEQIGTPNPANLYLMNRPDLLYTFSKINLWKLIQFRKIVYIDADVVVLRAPEELFDITESFAAAPDVGWPDAFNTGVMVISPNQGDYSALRTLASAGDSFDGADQGLLNQYFEHKPWKRISFTYNTTPSANYQYEPAYRYYKRDISMVHFIGSEKPWQRGRSLKGMSGSFQELLSRWWAVWDRHFEVSTREYIDGLRHPPPYQDQRAFEQHLPPQPAYYATGYPIATTQPAPPPEPPRPQHRSSEIPMTEPGESAENISQGFVVPTPTVEQRRFSAPHMEWDATRGAPPVESRPEAGNFPTQVYEFNTDPAPFRPPVSSPEPPKDMWYEVPKEKPRPQEPPRAIFPWEEREVSKPSRKFFEDEVKPPEPEPAGKQESFADELEVLPEPVTPTTRLADLDATPPRAPQSTWEAFASSRNAWDDISGIDSYVRSLTAFQRNRGQAQAVTPGSAAHHPAPLGSPLANPSQAAALPPASVTALPDPEDLISHIDRRRESLILTHFPSALERPSLPVTPAPRRRGMFWGSEANVEGGDDIGDETLPVAEGVPDQSAWNPAQQLEALRRNSLLAATGKLSLRLPLGRQGTKELPQREMPSSAVQVPEDNGEAEPSTFPSSSTASRLPFSGGSSPHGLLSPAADSASTNNNPGETLDSTVTEMNTALNAASTAAPSVGDSLFRTPGFASGGGPSVDELDRHRKEQVEAVVSPTTS